MSGNGGKGGVVEETPNDVYVAPESRISGTRKDWHDIVDGKSVKGAESPQQANEVEIEPSAEQVYTAPVSEISGTLQDWRKTMSGENARPVDGTSPVEDGSTVYTAPASGIGATHEGWKATMSGKNAKPAQDSKETEGENTVYTAPVSGISGTHQEWKGTVNGANGQIQAQTANPYADKAAIVEAAARQTASNEQGQSVSEKQANYSAYAQNKPVQQTNPHLDRAAIQDAIQRGNANPQTQATPNLFAAGKMAGNSQAEGYGAKIAIPRQEKPADTKKAEERSSATLTAKEAQRQAQRPVDPNSSTAGADELARLLGYTSPDEEKRLRKASLTNQRIMAIGDALRHIGNLYYTSKGASPQKYNSPVLEEEARYQRAKALRDKANHTYLTYKQAKDRQDQQAKQWEMDFNLKVADAARKAGYTEAQIQALKERMANDKAYKEGQLALGKQRAADQKERWERQDQETRRHHDRQIGLGYSRLNETKRHNGVIESNRTSSGGRKTANGKGTGYVYSTKNGSVEIDKDYLSKNKINKRSLMTAMERAGAIDDEWYDEYDRLRWDEKAQDKMLDDAVSDWLMNDDAAEEYMVNHLKGQSSRTSTSKQHIQGFGGGSGNGKARISGFGGH